jgi:glucokinase
MIEVIGIDLGGTAIKLGRFFGDGTCIETRTIPTPQPQTPKAVTDVMVDAIAKIDPENKAVAIGIGTPGPSDAEARIARVAINLPGWVDVPLADWIEAKTGKPTVIANDANSAAVGEAWLGAGKNFQNFILLTLGTGVGGGIILNGKLFVGHNGAAGDLGLISLYPDGPKCNSGNQGSLEQYCSIGAIRRRTGRDPAQLGEAAKVGDEVALAFWQEYGRDLGLGLTSIIYVLTPEAVLIGGGVSASFEYFYPAVQAEVDKRVQFVSRVGMKILPAQLGNNAGMVGAARLALLKINQ